MKNKQNNINKIETSKPNTTTSQSRRDALKFITLSTGYALTVGATSAFLSGCKADTSTGWKPSFFTQEEIDIIESVSDRILPKTETVGAKDALVHRYIDTAVMNNYTEEEQEAFRSNLKKFDEVARDKYKKNFVKLDDAGKDDVLQILANEWKASKDDKDAPLSAFKEMRDLTIAGFSSSEVGAKEFFVYNPVPGPYQGCIPFSDVNGTWAL
jgi:hypothetical protein